MFYTKLEPTNSKINEILGINVLQTFSPDAFCHIFNLTVNIKDPDKVAWKYNITGAVDSIFNSADSLPLKLNQPSPSNVGFS